MTCFADVRPLVVDHGVHFLACGDEAADVVEEGA